MWRKNVDEEIKNTSGINIGFTGIGRGGL